MSWLFEPEREPEPRWYQRLHWPFPWKPGEALVEGAIVGLLMLVMLIAALITVGPHLGEVFAQVQKALTPK